MALQSIRITVGRTWRWTVDAKVAVSHDLRAYRRRIDVLKSGAGDEAPTLPWPPYRSTL